MHGSSVRKLYSQTRYNTKKKLQKDRAKLHINSVSLPTSCFVLKEFSKVNQFTVHSSISIRQLFRKFSPCLEEIHDMSRLSLGCFVF